MRHGKHLVELHPDPVTVAFCTAGCALSGDLAGDPHLDG